MIDKNIWKGKKVFITGHTGFKGSWLCLWLHSLGARVTGYSLKPPTEPSLFDLCRIDQLVHTIIADVRDLKFLTKTMSNTSPEIVIHMAAQPLVRDSYKMPVETYAINVMGTVSFLEAVRSTKSVRAVVNVTTDKCYENNEQGIAYCETQPLGGHDPYSNSKACSELVTSAYRGSYFNPKDYASHRVALATGRAGNVIGGGDWATDRLVPDCIRAFLKNGKVLIRNPKSIRPWQHVLEPLNGYMILAQKLYEHGPRYSGAWNFGPSDSDTKSVEWVVHELCKKWGGDVTYRIDHHAHPHEAKSLTLDCTKAQSELPWRPRWNLDRALESIVEWTKAYKANADLKRVCFKQIKEYSETGSGV